MNHKISETTGERTAATSGGKFVGSYAFDPDIVNHDSSARKKVTLSGQNALLSLISLDDFDGLRKQIHSKIRDKIDENPASEEEEENKDRLGKADDVLGGVSPMN